MINDYAKAYTEVLEIINHFSEEELKKIPQEKIIFYNENKDKDYTFKIDTSFDLAEQNISNKANAILISLFKDYFATEKQKNVLESLLNQNQQKLEIEKQKMYNSENIFKNNRKYKEDSSTFEEKEELALVEFKQSQWYKKILDFFKSIFKK